MSWSAYFQGIGIVLLVYMIVVSFLDRRDKKDK
jgi:hypothetical protein